MLCWMLKRPHSYISMMHYGARKLRLVRELAEFDRLYREQRGEPARLEQLVCAGMMLLAQCKGALPLRPELVITPIGFELLLMCLERRLRKAACD